MFCVPAETFDNVKGKFPIGFTIWDSSINFFERIFTDVIIKRGFYNAKRNYPMKIQNLLMNG